MDEFRKLKEEAITRMKRDLQYMEPLNIPAWAAATMMVPFFLYQATCLTTRLVWATLKFMAVTPVILICIWADLLLLLGWYCNEITKRVGK